MKTLDNINLTQKRVLTYLKNTKLQNQSCFNLTILFSVNPKDIIKFIERPDDCGNWPFDFVIQVQYAINKIDKIALTAFPKIEMQTEHDRVLSKLLRKNNYFAFGTNIFFKPELTVDHVIAYMERDMVIYEWNSDFAVRIEQEVRRVQEFLL